MDFQNIGVELVNELVRAIIPIIVAFVAALLVMAFDTARKWLAAKFGIVIAGIVSDKVLDGVRAAEQYLGTAAGHKRKEYAIAHAQAALKQIGINVDANLIASQVEAEIAKLKSVYP